MTRRFYSDEERAATLAALKANGGNLRATEAQTGVPRNTMRGWMRHPERAAPAKVRAAKEQTYAELYDRVTRTYLGRALEPEVVGRTSGKDAVIAAATATDKHRLLTGQVSPDGPPSITVIEIVMGRPAEPPQLGPAVEVVDAGPGGS